MKQLRRAGAIIKLVSLKFKTLIQFNESRKGLIEISAECAFSVSQSPLYLSPHISNVHEIECPSLTFVSMYVYLVSLLKSTFAILIPKTGI